MITPRQGLSTVALQSFGATQVFVVRSALGTVGCVAASLVPTHQVPVEPPPLWQPAMSPYITTCPLVDSITSGGGAILSHFIHAQHVCEAPAMCQALGSE